MFLTRISVAQPVFAVMMMAAIMVIGLFSFTRLGVEEFPEIDLPVVVVATTYPGAAPQTVESAVTRWWRIRRTLVGSTWRYSAEWKARKFS